jgi:hypothetical protein
VVHLKKAGQLFPPQYTSNIVLQQQFMPLDFKNQSFSVHQII